MAGVDCKVSADLIVGGKVRGLVEVGCVGRCCHSFICREKRGLVQVAARTLGDAIERKQAEEALRASEEVNRRVVENSFDCIKILDTDGRLLYMNPGGQRLMGWTEETTPLGCSWFDLWQGEERKSAVEAIAEAKAGRKGVCRTFCVTANGTPKWWETITTPIRDARGKVERLLSISRDITEQKQEEELRRSEAELRALFGGLNDSIFIVGDNGRILEGNDWHAVVWDTAETNSWECRSSNSTSIRTTGLCSKKSPRSWRTASPCSRLRMCVRTAG